MRIGELARRGGVPVGTVKYYLREGLLPAGTPTAATQAVYDERHLERLALVRALVGVGGLSIAGAGAVLRAIDDPPPSLHELLGCVCAALGPGGDVDEDAAGRARALVERWGWRIDPRSPALAQLGAALGGVGVVGLADPDAVLDRYAGLMGELAAGDLAEVPAGPPDEVVRFVVTAVVLLEPLLLAMRRLAQEDASARRFADPGQAAARPSAPGAPITSA
jgi:DNA-binding transcriptional MerR regulator